MKFIKEFFNQLEIDLSYASFCSAVKKLGSPQLALEYYQQPENQERVFNKQNYNTYDYYQTIARSHGLSYNYIHDWAEQLETSKDVIANEVLAGDKDHMYRDAYQYKSAEEKIRIALSNQHKFLKIKFR